MQNSRKVKPGWRRASGNENWEFDELGFMRYRYASINDQPITEADRKIRRERTG